MKKIIILGLLVLSTFGFAKVNTVVSILPQKTFVEAIGGDKVNVALMVKPGNSPHSYEPKPSQMKDIAKADIYFAIGVEFEEAWLHKFEDQNKKMKIADISDGIEKIEMAAHHHDEDDHKGHEHSEHAHHDHEDNHDKESHDGDQHDHDGKDPHIWTSPKNVKIIVQNIYEQLIKIDTVNKSYYKTNLDRFINEINQTDKQIKMILKNMKDDSKFMVFHPAWGYFAAQYNLVQLPIEVEGKSPKPKALAQLIKKAKEENVKAIFTQPEFSDSSAKIIANELNIKVIKTSPLNPKWSQNLINLAKAIAWSGTEPALAK